MYEYQLTAFRPLIDIPVSLVFTFFVMYIFGYSINVAVGGTREKDKLFVGGDFNNQPFAEFLRVE